MCTSLRSVIFFVFDSALAGHSEAVRAHFSGCEHGVCGCTSARVAMCTFGELVCPFRAVVSIAIALRVFFHGCLLRGRKGGGGNTSTSDISSTPLLQVPMVDTIVDKSLATGPSSGASYVAAAALPSRYYCMLPSIRARCFPAMFWTLRTLFCVPSLRFASF
jgi:hypothetical protein